MSVLPTDACYAEDWKRTNPDLVVDLRWIPRGPDGYADHFLADSTPGRDLLAMLTQSRMEGLPDTHIVFARSEVGIEEQLKKRVFSLI